MAKFEHEISINLVIKKNTYNAPTHEEIKEVLEKWMEENKEDYSKNSEWADTEEISSS